MTREEAIEHGKEQLDTFGGKHRDKYTAGSEG